MTVFVDQSHIYINVYLLYTIIYIPVYCPGLLLALTKHLPNL